MRARSLKPGFFKNEALAAQPPLARLLYEGLWCLADREGRLEDRPQRIKIEILPYDRCNIEALLSCLADAGFIRRYTIGQESYIDIPKFKCHQNPHKNEKDSVLPAYSDIAILREDFGTNPADSLFIDSLSTDSLNKPLVHPRANDSEFDTFWSLYPRKQGKGTAKKAWALAVKKTASQAIIEALESQLPVLITLDPNFIPMASTWLNGERWDDVLTTKRQSTTWADFPPSEPPMTEEEWAESVEACKESRRQFEEAVRDRSLGE